MLDLKDIKGLGAKRIAAFNNVGIFDCNQLLNYFPNKYYDFSFLNNYDEKIKTELTLKVKCVAEPKNNYIRNICFSSVKFEDKNSKKTFTAVWYNQPYIKNNICLNQIYFLYGRVINNKFVVHKHFSASSLNSNIVPYYKNIDGIPQKLIRDTIYQICNQENYTSLIDNNEILNELLPISVAYQKVHIPNSVEDIEIGKKRIQLEDMLCYAAINDLIANQKNDKNRKYKSFSRNDFENIIHFNLTQSQKLAIDEIYNDMKSKFCMNRILLGDVGSGKTLVAFASSYLAQLSGYQSILLAPTTILAKQHYDNAKKLFGNNTNLALLTSSLSTKESKDLYNKCENGEISLLIATHSVLNENLKFKNLALVIDDEQHRFGVAQRSLLKGKGAELDCLHLSATPIPRTLSLVLFGNVNISKLTERPMGESRVKTNILSSKKIEEMWEYIEDKINNENSKCFVILPQITASNENDDGVVSSIESLKKWLRLKDYKLGEIGIIHGKQNETEQSATLNKFKNGEIKLLLATTVVEVGVDIPDANIMVVYNADRFGLATLHQLRGRIGRNGQIGNCFVVSDTTNLLSIKRLKIFKEFNEGGQIASEDLKLRGSGTIYGTAQHGFNEIFSEITFDITEFDKAKQIYNILPESNKKSIIEHTKNKYQILLNKIVLN